MSLYVDKKYVNLVSSSLEKFKWKKVNLANCRCPICGDSELNKAKARGYFFSNTDSYFYKCHNCGVSYNIYKFLEIVSPSLFKQYCLEKFKEKHEVLTITDEIKIEIEIPQNTAKYRMIEELSPEHAAVKFLQQRKIPEDKWNRFGFTDSFGKFAQSFNPNYSNLLEKDERIIIPIFDGHNQLIGVQGRSIGKITPKYITLKKTDNVKLIYGTDTFDRSKPIFVVEGPIDSLFLPNSIACLGLGNFLEVRKLFPHEDLIFVIDNEPRSRNVANIMKCLIESGEKICIYPSNIKDKDINDMVLSGLNPYDIIQSNTFSGASALLAFNLWRKCQ